MGKKESKTNQLKEGSEKNHYQAIDDVHVNLDNRNHAIEDYGYGPMNPQLENIDFWNKKAKLWKNTPKEAMKSRCNNCAAFNQSKEILDRIADNLGPAGEKIVGISNLGFCEMFHFKCAGDRTCDAWLTGGPLKEEMSAGAIANSAGSGEIAGLGVTPPGKPANWGEPGVTPKQQKKHKYRVLRRAPPQALQEEYTCQRGKFAGEETFIVPGDMFLRAKNQKKKGEHWKKYIGEGDHDRAIKDYHRKYKGKKPIILQCERTGAMCYAHYGKKSR